MSLRFSHLMTLTTSVMWVSRLISLLMRCERSPRPVSVGVNTLWLLLEQVRHPPPAPAAMPRAVHEHESLALRGLRPGWRAAERRRAHADTGACEHGAAGEWKSRWSRPFASSPRIIVVPS